MQKRQTQEPHRLLGQAFPLQIRFVVVAGALLYAGVVRRTTRLRPSRWLGDHRVRRLGMEGQASIAEGASTLGTGVWACCILARQRLQRQRDQSSSD